MAGYVLKIMIEDTHPPVWRRVIIPEKITFEELHDIIQILFDWTGDHLHEFIIPSERICIDNGEDPEFGDYVESEILVDAFFPRCKWIRYTYDFGDDWRHKIIYEKTDESYDRRIASLLKVKGDNFPEDCGGVWGAIADEARMSVFDEESVTRRLQALVCPIHEELAERMIDWNAQDVDWMIENMLEKMMKNFHVYASKNVKEAPSQMARKINALKEFLEEESSAQEKEIEEGEFVQLSLPFVSEDELRGTGFVLKIAPGDKKQGELLCDLGLQELNDYCKYLQIVVENSWTRVQKAEAIAQELRKHSEYILYVLDENQYKEFLRFTKLPYGVIKERAKDNDMWNKAVSLGLADVTVEKRKNRTTATICFAKDILEIVKPLTADVKKQTFRKVKRFSKKLEELILVYGMIDFEVLPEMFREIYHEDLAEKELRRYIYWYARMNNLVQTVYTSDGENYVGSVQLDLEFVQKNMERYAKHLNYVIYPASEIKKMAGNIGEMSEMLNYLFETLHFRLGILENQAAALLEEMYCRVVNGYPIGRVMECMSCIHPEDAGLLDMCELWSYTTGIMHELILPMLKGRSRVEYAGEEDISPYEIGMVEDGIIGDNVKERRMCEFSAEIQESMYLAHSFVDRDEMENLRRYQEKGQVLSEEFLALLAESYVAGCEFEKAQKLVRKLKISSVRGKKAANILADRINDGQSIIDDDERWDIMTTGINRENFSLNPDESWLNPVNQPYVREMPKIGRNDPCPCGSGKKYKKCCGRN